MHFEKPQTSEIETKDLRRLYASLEKAREALARKGGSTQNPIANSHLAEAEAKMKKILKLDAPRHDCQD